MIKLFHIPNHTIDTSRFSNLLQDKIVTEFEQQFAEYVGAKYAVSLNSATSGIFLIFTLLMDTETVIIPSVLPPVVPNAIITGLLDGHISFSDNVDWVGSDYVLLEWENGRIIDSAHRIDRDQYKNEAKSDNDITLFSFFPTKPISGSNGGMVVSNSKEAIDAIRLLSNNGMSQESNSWDRKHTTFGYKMAMDSIQAYIANENLKNLDYKKEKLASIRDEYNKAFGLSNTSDHLYRISVTDADIINNKQFVEKAKAAGIQCGIHYQALHHNPIFEYEGPLLPKSDHASKSMVSIPFHEKLLSFEVNTVIEFVNKYR